MHGPGGLSLMLGTSHLSAEHPVLNAILLVGSGLLVIACIWNAYDLTRRP